MLCKGYSKAGPLEHRKVLSTLEIQFYYEFHNEPDGFYNRVLVVRDSMTEFLNSSPQDECARYDNR